MAVKYTEEQLNSVDKSFLIQLLLQQQEQLEAMTKELHASNEKMQLLMEQVILGKQNRFGRSSEKMEDTSQICFREVDGTIVFLNEAEAVCDLNAAEPEDLERKSPKQPKRKGKKEADLSGLPFRRIDHYLSEEELEAEFGVKGWKQLPDAISREYHFVPAKVEVEEHHIGVYASKTDEHMVRADHPKALLHGSLVSPSLGAAIINGKYVNAVPLYRLEQEFHGAKSSAIIYSIVETAKANNLKPFDYVQHLLEEIPKHMNDKDCSFLEDLLPWSEKLPAGIRKA